MTEPTTERTVPSLTQVSIRLHGTMLARFEAFCRAAGWPPEDTVRILLAYPSVVKRGSGLSPQEVRDEMGAARGELATLRHRAYMADEALRTLEWNITGFTASLQQFEKLFPSLQREEAALRARLDALQAEAARRGLTVEPEESESPPSTRRLFDFFRRHTTASPNQK